MYEAASSLLVSWITRVVMDKMKVNPSGSFKFDICQSFNSWMVGCYAWQYSEHHGKFFHATGMTNIKISVGGCHTSCDRSWDRSGKRFVTCLKAFGNDFNACICNKEERDVSDKTDLSNWKTTGRSARACWQGLFRIAVRALTTGFA